MMTRYCIIYLTQFQAQVIIDALDMRTEGTQGDMTKREVQAAARARKVVADSLSVAVASTPRFEPLKEHNNV